MERLRTIIIILILLGAFFGYSYYNYNGRANAVNAVEEYRKENNLTQIWHFREMHFNVFDWLLDDKSQNSFIFVNSNVIKKEDNENYRVQFCNWKDAQKLETMTNYTLERTGDKFRITVNDLFWLPTNNDSLDSKEAKGTIFEIVDNWIKNEYKDTNE